MLRVSEKGSSNVVVENLVVVEIVDDARLRLHGIYLPLPSIWYCSPLLVSQCLMLHKTLMPEASPQEVSSQSGISLRFGEIFVFLVILLYQTAPT